MAKRDGDFAAAPSCPYCNAHMTVGDEGQCPNPDCPTQGKQIFHDRRGEK